MIISKNRVALALTSIVTLFLVLGTSAASAEPNVSEVSSINIIEGENISTTASCSTNRPSTWTCNYGTGSNDDGPYHWVTLSAKSGSGYVVGRFFPSSSGSGADTYLGSSDHYSNGAGTKVSLTYKSLMGNTYTASDISGAHYSRDLIGNSVFSPAYLKVCSSKASNAACSYGIKVK